MSTLDLLNRATAVLQLHLQPDGLTDQQALEELHAIFDVIQMEHGDVPCELITQAAEILRQHRREFLTASQAMDEMYGVLNGNEANALAELALDPGDKQDGHCASRSSLRICS